MIIIQCVAKKSWASLQLASCSKNISLSHPVCYIQLAFTGSCKVANDVVNPDTPLCTPIKLSWKGGD